MITIIAGTNRKASKTEKIAGHIENLLNKKEVKCHVIYLSDIEPTILHGLMYEEAHQCKSLSKIQDNYIIPADKFIVISPEYNGSFPGALKLFIDALSIRSYAANFKHKKIGLVGVSSGWLGNTRGMDHLSDIFSYLGALCYPSKMAIPKVETNFDGQNLTDTTLEQLLVDFIDQFVAF